MGEGVLHEELKDKFYGETARLFSEKIRAHRLLKLTRIDKGKLPNFGEISIEDYWWTARQEIEAGRFGDADEVLERLVRKALGDYKANKVFREAAEVLGLPIESLSIAGKDEIASGIEAEVQVEGLLGPEYERLPATLDERTDLRQLGPTGKDPKKKASLGFYFAAILVIAIVFILFGQDSKLCTVSVASAPSNCGDGTEVQICGLALVRVCGRGFLMGTPDDSEYFDEGEGVCHRSLDEYWIGKFEITNRQYHRFDPEHVVPAGERDFPVIGISWEGAQKFCANYGMRLPEEAEWELAARAGTTTAWCSGDDKREVRHYAWYAENSHGTTHEVGTREANAWGIHDMHGNALEWTKDVYRKNCSSPNPTYGGYGVRGGSFKDTVLDIRSARRTWRTPEDKSEVGFRCVLEGVP